MARDNPINDTLGGTVGSRVARILADATVHTRAKMGPHQAAIAQTVLRDFTNHVSDEIRGVMAPLWSKIADSPDVPDYLRNLARALATQRGQAWSWIAGTSTSAAMGGGLLFVVQNELQPVLGSIIRANPHMPVSPADAALAVSRGLWTESRAWRDAGQAGLDEQRFAALIELNRNVPSESVIIELLGKGWMTETQATAAFLRAGWDPQHARQLFPLQRTWISPRDGGSMFQRSIVDMKGLEEIVRRNGHHVSDAAKYAELAGEPLPVQDIMTAQRRGFIDVGRARRGWVQGPVRNEWFDVAQQLQYAPMSSVDAADAVNQGHMTREQGATIAGWNGLMPEHFGTLIENAGLPPGVELASEALNRGLLTLPQFRTAFLESRLKNKYVDLYVQLRYRVVPQETVRRLYREGVYTRDQAKQRLGHAGFAPEDAEALLAAEDHGTDQSTKELTKAEIVSLYSDRAIDQAQAEDMLTLAGFGPGEVAWLLMIADLRRSRKYADAVIARLRAGYVAYRLEASEASAIMDRLRIPVDQRDELIDLWDLERLATTRGLTAAQVKTALRKQLIDNDAAMVKLRQQGYSDEDAGLFLAL